MTAPATGYWQDLQLQPGSGLTSPWAEYLSVGQNTSQTSMGPDGVTQGMGLLCYWRDLEAICQNLLGYSWRNTRAPASIATASNASPIVITTSLDHLLTSGDVVTVSGVATNTNANGSWVVTVLSATTFSLNDSITSGAGGTGGNFIRSSLQRNLPWRHPKWSQLWCTRISQVQGLQWTGKKLEPVPAFDKAGIIIGSPASEYTLALLSLQFERPNYVVLSDDQITEGQEYRRYLDRYWQTSIQMLSREGSAFKWAEGNLNTDTPAGPRPGFFKGSVGQKLAHHKIKRTWYQLPEQAIYDANGFPAILARYAGCVNSIDFLGFPAGTLLMEPADITPQPLQLPPELMQLFSEGVQLQCNVTFNFDYFDPPLGTGATTRGHNTMPWSGDGKWYKVTSQIGNYTPFVTKDFYSLFRII